MNEFRMAICDDERIHIDHICSYLAAYESESGNRLLVDAYDSPLELLEKLKSGEQKYDILFLDVDMPEMQGTDLAEQIRRFDKKTIICFITAYEHYAYRAFRVEAMGYLVKPVKYVDFKHLTDKCLIHIQYEQERDSAKERYFRVKTERNETVVLTQDILYIEKRRNKCVFHTVEREITSYDTLAKVYEQLNPKQFCYVHQGFIVNFDYIKEVLPDRLFLASDLELPVSRRYYKAIHDRHMDKIERLRAERRMASPQFS